MLNEEIGILVSDASSSPAISTLPGLLLDAARQHRNPDAFKFKRNDQWISVSTDEFLLRVEELFFAIRSLGLRPHDRAVILSENRLEWAIADYATLCAGATTVPIYPTFTAPQVEALLKHCEPAIIFVSTAELLEKVLAARRRVAASRIVVFDPNIRVPDVTRLDALYEMGRQSTYDAPEEFRRSALSVGVDDVASIIYTSGTSGVPKGAMLTHRNLVSNIVATSERLPLQPGDVNLSFLPLSHIFQRHVDYAAFRAGATTAYSPNLLTVAEDLRQVRPTFAAGVPHFFQKIHARICFEVSRRPALARCLFDKALRIGRKEPGSSRPSLAYKLANRLIFKKVRVRLGGRIRFFISGGAALDREIAEFFWAIGVPIYEGYGLSETSPVITLNGPGAARLGTVGQPIGDQEIQIARDKEILVRGSNVMKGYYRMDAETEEAFSGGWFHTGDIGELDADGFLKITDRKKDIIVTSSGKNVAPQAIENRLRLIPYFENLVVVGDGRHFISALIVPNYDALVAYARNHKISFENPHQLTRRTEILALAMAEIENRTTDLAPFEKVRKIAFVEDQFSISGGELTPTLKVRRSAVEKKYKSLIDQLYA